MRPSRKKKRFETLLWNWDFVYLCLALSLDESSGEGVTAHIYTFYSDNKLIISRCDSRDCGEKNFFTHFSQLLTFKSSKIRSRDSEISSRRETSLSMKFIRPKKLWHSFKVYKVFLLEKAKELSAACLHIYVFFFNSYQKWDKVFHTLSNWSSFLFVAEKWGEYACYCELHKFTAMMMMSLS